MIELNDVRKNYKLGDVDVEVLKGVTLSVDEGEHVSIMGPSGSGKSTLLHILGCLDTPTSGVYRLANRDVGRLTDSQLATVRAREIGFVFQQFCLIKYLSVLDNVVLALEYLNVEYREARRTAISWLERVHLGHRLTHVPRQLSGGERQRVAIARAVSKTPKLVLADEPTGNLDSRTQEEIIELFGELNRDLGLTIMVITHSPEVAARTRRTIALKDGAVR
ncbi:MAG: ABC transporter ATP-binding protein [Candidatus Wallbacteria bacterium]|nr:ABC transporter ATP-binding protein [Candidatus Wallbacteria bacterium]